MKFWSIIITGLIGIVFACLFSSIAVWLLWNWLMPLIFGLKTITWAQALGLSFLCQFLFGNNKVSVKS